MTKKICLINGSPRGNKAASMQFLNDLDKMLEGSEYEKEIVSVKIKLNNSYPEETLSTIAGADAIIIAFPLYYYCLPGALARLLEEFYRYTRDGHPYNKNASVYAIVNCGHPDPEINMESIKVMKEFCRRTGLNWRFAISFGGGCITAVTKNIPVLNSKTMAAYEKIVRDINGRNTAGCEDIHIKPVLPRALMLKFRDNEIIKRIAI